MARPCLLITRWTFELGMCTRKMGRAIASRLRAGRQARPQETPLSVLKAHMLILSGRAERNHRVALERDDRTTSGLPRLAGCPSGVRRHSRGADDSGVRHPADARDGAWANPSFSVFNLPHRPRRWRRSLGAAQDGEQRAARRAGSALRRRARAFSRKLPQLTKSSTLGRRSPDDVETARPIHHAQIRKVAGFVDDPVARSATTLNADSARGGKGHPTSRPTLATVADHAATVSDRLSPP